MHLPVGKLDLADIRLLLDPSVTLSLPTACHDAVRESEKIVAQVIAKGTTTYGINTGFGALASTRIEDHELARLQHHLILSHAAGVGDPLSDECVRLIMSLKINSLCRGYSGVRWATIEALLALFNAQLYPIIPAQGSVGASGDLAPLAHLSAVLLGEGEVRQHGKIISALDALAQVGLKPLQLAPKEGLALLNGTQVSTALALIGLLQAETIFTHAMIAGAMSVDATRSSIVPFDARIQNIRGHAEQINVASLLRELLAGSEINSSHVVCHKVQDSYSLRCQPQVMGACLAQLKFAAHTLLVEANAVSDNPLVFANDGDILSGGNFHAEPVAFAADNIALAIAEIGSISERRTALLMDPKFSGLPAFLVANAGVNSGFMLAHVTAAALTSENKCLAMPASIDSIPTSANQEDHVSMATHASRRLLAMTNNAANIIAIELLAACQGFDFLRPLTSSQKLEDVFQQVRKKVAFYSEDRYFSIDIKKIYELIRSNHLASFLPVMPLST